MTAENLNIVLTNSLCCISAQAVKVSKLYSIGNKCANSELQKLKLMNDWFEALRCYNANESINAEFALTIPYTNYIALSNVLRNYTVSVNGVESTLPGDGIKTTFEIFSELLDIVLPNNTINIVIDDDREDERFVTIYITGLCDTENITLSTSLISTGALLNTINFTKYKNGLCTVLNCLTEADFNILLSKLMKECDICDCQLTT
jgi:hypothetical protein